MGEQKEGSSMNKTDLICFIFYSLKNNRRKNVLKVSFVSSSVSHIRWDPSLDCTTVLTPSWWWENCEGFQRVLKRLLWNLNDMLNLLFCEFPLMPFPLAPSTHDTCFPLNCKSFFLFLFSFYSIDWLLCLVLSYLFWVFFCFLLFFVLFVCHFFFFVNSPEYEPEMDLGCLGI